MKLYDYYRSSSCYRVRIALHLKQIHYEAIPIHLLNQGGEQHLPGYRNINPQGLVPTLDENGHILSQSLAIIEYLDDLSPQPPLFPSTPLARAQVRKLAYMIACDIHPLNNLRVLQTLRSQFQADDHQTISWYHHWLKIGFEAIETELQAFSRKQSVCYGQDISLADICLIPQVYNAKRYNFPLQDYPLINEINNYCMTLDAFKQALPKEE